MKKMKLVMVGNGMAGVRTLEELLKIAPDLYDITVFGAEPHPNYNRILLSPVLAGEQTLDEIVLNDWSWYSDNGITLHAGVKVTEVDRIRRVVHGVNAAGEPVSAPYDRLIMATGSNPFILPIPGKGSSDFGYAWVPVVGPVIGGVLGAVCYQALWPATG